MKITAKLAWNQIKRNRYRTIGAILASVLSTALTTAVFCFVTSANTMLVSFLGEGYGEYGGAYKSIILIPALAQTQNIAISHQILSITTGSLSAVSHPL